MTSLNKTSKTHPWWWVAGLFLVTVALRLPFTSQYLYHSDSVNMAFEIINFDVQHGAPQYPGYIVYIALSKLVNLVINDPQTTMVLISIISSGLASVAIFYLGRDMFSKSTGLIAAIFLATSPLVWFYGEIALPHTLDLFATIIVVWLLYRIMEGETRLWWITAFLMALLAGLRQQDLIFLGPVALFALYRIGLRRLLLFAAIGAVVCVAWFIPLIQNVGGLSAYIQGSNAYTRDFMESTSLLSGAGAFGFRRNLINKLIPYTLYGWALALVPALVYWGTRFPQHGRTWLRRKKLWFLVLWMAPTLAFYVVIHMGQQGLVFVFLPALFLLSAEGLRRLFSSRTQWTYAATAAIALADMLVFAVLPTYPLGTSGPKLLTYDTIQVHDQWLKTQTNAVLATFPSQNTVILSSEWRFMQYYLPDYPLAQVTIGSKWEIGEGQIQGADFDTLSAEHLALSADSGWQVVVVDDNNLEAAIHAPVETLPLKDGSHLSFLNLDANQTLAFNPSDLAFEVSRSSPISS